MNREGHFKAVLTGSAVIALVMHFFSGAALSLEPQSGQGMNYSPKFESSEDFMAHLNESETCANARCHADLATGAETLHDPVSSGQCTECHMEDEYPNRFGLELDQRTNCSNCHKNMELKIQTSISVHGPIVNRDCSSCHDPHDSDQPFLLRQSYNKLCLSCHKLASFNSESFMHEPVKDGNCGLCHDPHASNFKARLIDSGFNLCIPCHENMVEGMTEEYIHKPIIESGCSSCHDPHSGSNKLRLKKSESQLCFSCHQDKKSEVENYEHKHKPASEGDCTACHSPHYSDKKGLLIDNVDTLCYNCHKQTEEWRDRKYKHGPVIQGNCTACHNPHGSDNPFILKLAFPHKFYSEYEDSKYSLCFLCHIKALVTAEETRTITSFRNEEVNLHALHVKQKKGRTCRACHNVHASNQDGRIRESIPFGSYKIELKYFKTENGGKCISGCHVERGYDRLSKVTNARTEIKK